MSASPRQLSANRRNAQRSTGPRTAAGKQRASRNAVTHGIHARQVVTSASEHEDDFETLRADLVDDLKPEGAAEHLLVDQIATLTWRMRRVLRAEAGAINLSTAEAVARPAADREQTVKYYARMAAVMGSADEAGAFYRVEFAGHLREAIEQSATGQNYLVTVLRGARESIAQHVTLDGPDYRRLIDTVGRDSDLGRLLTDPAVSSPEAPPEFRSSILDLIDRYIETAGQRAAAFRERDGQTELDLIAQHSLPPDREADKILRYEKTLGNALARARSDLLRLQARRGATFLRLKTSK